MWLKYCWLLYYMALTTRAVQISMSGAIQAGSGVADIISQYFKDGSIDSLNGRRSMSTFDDLVKNISDLELCRDKQLTLCNSNMEDFLLRYVLALIDSVRKVFDGILDDEHCKVTYMQKTLKQVVKVIKSSDVDTDEVHKWTNVLKKISASFLDKSLLLAEESSDKMDSKKREAMILIRQQLVFGILKVEKEYQNMKLCRELRLCPFQYDASTYLQHFLNLVKTMNETKVRRFIKAFKRNFLRAPLFKELDEKTSARFDQILNDMMLHEKVSAKNIILSITDPVQKRLSLLEAEGKDGFLLQAILSDLDHLYVGSVDEPIETFLDAFEKWLKDNDSQVLGSIMEAFYNGLGAHFKNQPAELVSKLKIETLVFLELTMM